MRTVARLTLLVTAVILPALLAGCGRTSFISRKYDNFTAYYNKFYNAERAFDTADSRQQAQRPVDRQLMLTVFPVSDRAGSSTEYENAIRKSADVLRNHENSKWVDDALMLIGRAYFNQRNFVSAEQKFREVMALDTKLHDEARYWLARSQIAGGQYEAAMTGLAIALDDEELDRKWRPYLLLAIGELHVRQGEYEAAVQPLSDGLDGPDRSVAGRAQFLLGQVHERLGDYDAALEAYGRVERYKPDYELSFAAQVRAIEVQAARGEFEEAERALRRMERDDKNFENRGSLALVRARILHADGRTEEARAEATRLLRSSTQQTPTVRGGMHYTLAVIYRDVDEDFDRAAAHFDTAATALQNEVSQRAAFGAEHGIQDPFAPGAIVDVLEQRDVFSSFARVSERVSRLDSLLELGAMDEESFRLRIAEIREQRVAQMREDDRLREERDIQSQFSSQSASQSASGFGALPSGKEIGDAATSEAGFLFHKEPARVQQAFQRFRDRWGDRPLVPGWRISDRLTGVTRASDDVDSTALAGVDAAGPDRYATYTVDVSDVPRSFAAKEDTRSERALARYELGNALFLSMNMPDSATTWYRMVIEEDADEPVAIRAHYALAEAYRALGMDDQAGVVDRQRQQRHPGRELAVADDEPGAAEPEPSLDSDPAADAWYMGAFDVWQNAQYPRATLRMLETAARFPNTTAAPRALLAIGYIAGDWARRDSLDLVKPLPISIPDTLAEAFGWEPDSLAVLMAASDSTSAVDTTGASVAGVVDSVAGVVDSVAVEVDSVAVEVDSVAVEVDSVAVEVDSVAVDSDASSVDSDASSVESDSVDALVDEIDASHRVRPRLVDVYEYLTTRYAEEPEARQAGPALSELAALDEERRAYADSVAAAHAAARDSTVADSAMAVSALDSATDAVPEDSVLASGEEQPPARTADSSFVSDTPVKQAPSVEPAEASIDSVAAAPAEPVVYDTSQVDLQPELYGGEQAIHRAIEYTELDDGISGVVEVSFVVSPSGQVVQVAIEQGLSESANREVLRAMYQMRFRPGLKDSRPVAVRMTRRVAITVE